MNMARGKGGIGRDLLHTIVNAVIDTDNVQGHAIDPDRTEATAIDTVQGAESTDGMTSVQSDHGIEDLIASTQLHLRESTDVGETHGADRPMRTTGDGIESLSGYFTHSQSRSSVAFIISCF